MAHGKNSVNWFRQFTTTKQTATRHYEKPHFAAGGMAKRTLVYSGSPDLMRAGPGVRLCPWQSQPKYLEPFMTSSRSSSNDSLNGLALEAVEHRLQALSEYLAVYRAGLASGVGGCQWRQARVLRSDISRLQAWWWYLSSQQRGAGWVRLMDWLVRWLAPMVPLRKEKPRRRHSARSMRRLGSFSLVMRAYVTLEEDLQGQLLTRRLTAKQFPGRVNPTQVSQLEARLEQAILLRRTCLPEPRKVAICCQLLRLVMVLRQWLGLPLPTARVLEP